MATGRHADTTLWYQRVAAAAAAAASQDEGGTSGGTPWSEGGNHSGEEGGRNSEEGGGGSRGAAAGGYSEGGGYQGREAGPEGAAGFLAAALEGSSNSSRLDAKLAVGWEGRVDWQGIKGLAEEGIVALSGCRQGAKNSRMWVQA